MKKGNTKTKMEKKNLIGIITTFLVLTLVGVYALSAGGVGNPGHNIDSITAPAGCENGEILVAGSNGWECQEVPLPFPATIEEAVTSHDCYYNFYQDLQFNLLEGADYPYSSIKASCRWMALGSYRYSEETYDYSYLTAPRPVCFDICNNGYEYECDFSFITESGEETATQSFTFTCSN